MQRANDRLLEGLSSLFSGCSDEQLRGLLGHNYRRFRKLPFMKTTFSGRPVAPLTELAVQLRQFEMLLPAELDLHTSRGGCWPVATDV